jgi:ZipA, C-terminal FtsZ-binding domain
MSTLQISLAVAGGLVLAGIVAHGAWSSRKNTPRQADPEPTLPAGMAPTEPREPVFDQMELALDLSLPVTPLADKRPGLDALIDVIALISLESPIYGEVANNAMPTTRRAGSKPFAIEGQNTATQHWELPMAGQRYSAFQAGVQMANRTGALNEIEYSEFVMKAQGFADGINGAPDFPEMLEAVAHARELDQFASTHDAHLGFRLRAKTAAWSPGYIQQNAAKLGFTSGTVPGRLVLHAATTGLPPVLNLVFDPQAALAEDPALSAVFDVALNLEVPLVERADRPYQRLRETAQALAAAMDGTVTDDHGQPLPSEAMDQIGSELEQLYDALEGRDFAAGSVLARRLFS